MKLLLIHNKILEYLDKHGPVNTFRLSRDLGIDRARLINIVKGLTKKGLAEFKGGIVTSVKKELQKILKKPKIPKKEYSELDKIKRKIQKSKNEWLKKQEGLKKEIGGLQTQRENIAQKLSEERKLLYKTRKEKNGIEKNLAEKEKSLKQREEAVKKEEESISITSTDLEKEKERIAKARKKLRKDKKKISKATILKEDITKLEATLEKLKKKKVKPKVAKKIERPKVREIKSILKPEIKEPIKEIRVSNIETREHEILAESQLSTIKEENTKEKFHDLIEQEISLLRQKRNDEAKNIHFQIRDMIFEVTDPNERKTIIKDWNRISEFY